MPNQFSFLLLMALLSLFSCQKSETEVVDPQKGYEYFPSTAGKYVDYAYDSLIINAQGKNHRTGFLREEVGDTLNSSLGPAARYLNIYWKKNLNDSWKLQRVETVVRNESNAIVTDNNIPLIKLAFPNIAGKFWDGNALFDEEVEKNIGGELVKIYKNWGNYRIIAHGTTLTIGTENYNVVEVKEVDASDILSRRYSKAFYAKNIGLVKREMKIYDTQHFQQGVEWEEFAEAGFSLTQEIIGHN